MHLAPWLLGGAHLVEAGRYRSFAPHIARDAAVLRSVVAAFGDLEKEFDRAVEEIDAPQRGYFTPDEDDRVRRLLLSYRNLRLASYQAVWRYLHYPLESDPAIQLKGFILGYAAALNLYNKSLKFIRTCGASTVVRAKLNEPDERFGIGAGFFDEVIAAYCSLRQLLLLGAATRFWHKHRRRIRELGLENDAEVGEFIPLIRELRLQWWPLFGEALRARFRHERRGALKLLFFPFTATTQGLLTLTGYAVAQMWTTLDYRPAIRPANLAWLAPRLQPGDLLFTRTEHKVTTALLPGFFAHAAIYIGRAADLEVMGLAEHPMMRQLLPRLRAEETGSGWILEARNQGVIIQTLEQALECDHVLALRPALSSELGRQMLAEAFEHYGKPYDFDFDFSRSSHIVCTELVYRSLHGKAGFAFELIKRMGRYTLTVDDIIRRVLQDWQAEPQRWQVLAFLTEWRNGGALPVEVSACPELLAELVGSSSSSGERAEAAPMREVKEQ